MKKGNKSVFKQTRRGVAIVLPIIPIVLLLLAGVIAYKAWTGAQLDIAQTKTMVDVGNYINAQKATGVLGAASQQELSAAGCPDDKTSTLQARTVNPMNLTGIQQLAATVALVDKLPPMDGSAGVAIQDGITATLTRGSAVAMGTISSTARCPSSGYIVVLGSTDGIDSGDVAYDVTSDPAAYEIIAANMTNAKFQVYDGNTNISNQAAGPVMTTTAIAMSASGTPKSIEIWVDPIVGSAPVGTALYGNLWAIDLKDNSVFSKDNHKGAFTAVSGGVNLEPLATCPYGTADALNVDVCWKSGRILGTTKFGLTLTPGTGEPTTSTQPVLYRITPNYFQNTDGKVWFGAYDSAATYKTGVTNTQTIAVT